jgi:hypothetical protein
MVIDFELKQLTEYEDTVVLPAMVKILHKRVGVEKATTNRMIGRKLAGKGIAASPLVIRRIIHHIRIHNIIVNLIANSYGYYIAKNRDEVEKYVISLRGRARSIMDVAESYY